MHRGILAFRAIAGTPASPDNRMALSGKSPMLRRTLRLAAFTLTLAAATVAQAGELARTQMVLPLAPGAWKHTSLPMPTSLVRDQPVWVAYRVLAMSANPEPTGDIVLSGSFEGVITPITEETVVFSPEDMARAESAGTIQQQIVANHGKRTDQELIAAWGQPIFDAYTALNRKSGAILEGTLVKTLPPLGDADATLLVSVERDSDMHPVLVEIIAGQGDLPPTLQTAAAKSSPFRVGWVLGLLAFFGLIAWLVFGRRNG